MSDNLNDITRLKQKLVSYLVSQIENPQDGMVDKTALSTAAKLVKDFMHEIDENGDTQAAMQNSKLQSYFQKKTAGLKSVN